MLEWEIGPVLSSTTEERRLTLEGLQPYQNYTLQAWKAANVVIHDYSGGRLYLSGGGTPQHLCLLQVTRVFLTKKHQLNLRNYKAKPL